MVCISLFVPIRPPRLRLRGRNFVDENLAPESLMKETGNILFRRTITRQERNIITFLWTGFLNKFQLQCLQVHRPVFLFESHSWKEHPGNLLFWRTITRQGHDIITYSRASSLGKYQIKRAWISIVKRSACTELCAVLLNPAPGVRVALLTFWCGLRLFRVGRDQLWPLLHLFSLSTLSVANKLDSPLCLAFWNTQLPSEERIQPNRCPRWVLAHSFSRVYRWSAGLESIVLTLLTGKWPISYPDP